MPWDSSHTEVYRLRQSLDPILYCLTDNSHQGQVLCSARFKGMDARENNTCNSEVPALVVLLHVWLPNVDHAINIHAMNRYQCHTRLVSKYMPPPPKHPNTFPTRLNQTNLTSVLVSHHTGHAAGSMEAILARLLIAEGETRCCQTNYCGARPPGSRLTRLDL
jgi:hypothetical protein